MSTSKQQPEGGKERAGRRVSKLKVYTVRALQAMVLVLSVLLIVYISYDTFTGAQFLENSTYMKFQLWVCIVFLVDFFVEMKFAADKLKYLRNRWFFFLISIPYLNIINHFGLVFSENVIYYLRFVPLLRGAYSLSMVLGYVSQNKAVSLLTQYVAILASSVYILALIFFYQEFGVNPHVKTFWDALYWACMNMTTVGCDYSSITVAGKVISVILPILGMMIFPLFTVYFSQKVASFTKRHRRGQLPESGDSQPSSGQE